MVLIFIMLLFFFLKTFSFHLLFSLFTANIKLWKFIRKTINEFIVGEGKKTDPWFSFRTRMSSRLINFLIKESDPIIKVANLETRFKKWLLFLGSDYQDWVAESWMIGSKMNLTVRNLKTFSKFFAGFKGKHE